MAFKLNSILKEKKVLYVVMFAAVANFFVYLLSHNWTAAVIFALISYLSTYFSKNMIVVLLTALIGTNIIIASRILGKRVVEGMKGKKDDKDDEDEEDDKNKDEIKEAFEVDEPVSVDKKKVNKEKYTNKSDINYAATLESAYDNLDNLIGKDGIDKMSQDTAKLVAQQNKLLKNLENMAPLLDNAGKLLNSLPVDSINKIQSSIGGVLGNLKGISN